ncbi:MAG: hypothetical protein DLM58_20660 [Pseudonocardiales bacterium]|nr:MAG: hypothetical protein DLM58_20660 [Pseudonocardiales bacterium]
MPLLGRLRRYSGEPTCTLDDLATVICAALNVLVLWNTQYMDDAIGHHSAAADAGSAPSTSRDSHRYSTSTP